MGTGLPGELGPHCSSMRAGSSVPALLLAGLGAAHAFTAPMMAAPRVAAPGASHLRMMAAGPERSAFSLPSPRFQLGGRDLRAGVSSAPSSKLVAPLKMSGGGGSGVGNGGGGGGGGGGDDSSGLPADILAILSAKNIAASALPKDITAAVIAGRVGASEVAAWAAMYTGFFRKLFAAMWLGPGVRNRIMANDRFMLVMALELAIGCVSKMAAEWRERNSRGAFWKELDFVASDMALEIIGDFTLVYLLSPFAATRAPSVSAFGKLVASFPAHFLAPGAFSLAQRGGAIVYKGCLFWMVGLAASLIGHSTTVTLMKARGVDTSAMASVMDNSIQWGESAGRGPCGHVCVFARGVHACEHVSRACVPSRGSQAVSVRSHPPPPPILSPPPPV